MWRVDARRFFLLFSSPARLCNAEYVVIVNFMAYHETTLFEAPEPFRFPRSQRLRVHADD